MFPTRDARDQHEAGWTGCLGKFVAFLAGRLSTGAEDGRVLSGGELTRIRIETTQEV